MTTLHVQEPERLYWRELGDGATPVLFLHCGLGHSGMAKGLARVLSNECRILAPDFPGHGKSDGFLQGADVHTATTDAVRSGLGDGVHLVGHSFGATVALRLAMESPDKVRSLTMIEPVFFAAAKGRATFAAHRLAENDVFTAYQAGDLMTAARVFNRLWGGGASWDSLRDETRFAMAEGMPFVAGTEPSLWQDIHGLLAPGRLELLHIPVTMIRGDKTLPIIADVHAGLCDRLPQARDAVIPGAGHMSVLTHAREVGQQIGETIALAGSQNHL